MVHQEELLQFVRESNRIEGIHRPPTKNELEEHKQLLALEEITVDAIEDFVTGVTDGMACLRRAKGRNVWIHGGGKVVHTPPPGGPQIEKDLQQLVQRINALEDPYALHHDYETLHPFTDGNGRSGRALWLWGHLRQGGSAGLGFLHQWYYDSLADRR